MVCICTVGRLVFARGIVTALTKVKHYSAPASGVPVNGSDCLLCHVSICYGISNVCAQIRFGNDRGDDANIRFVEVVTRTLLARSTMEFYILCFLRAAAAAAARKLGLEILFLLVVLLGDVVYTNVKAGVAAAFV